MNKSDMTQSQASWQKGYFDGRAGKAQRHKGAHRKSYRNGY